MNKISAKQAKQTPEEEWRARGGVDIWLPYTQMKTARAPLMAARTEGCRIILEDGRELVDGTASWWTACHGYNHPHILKAMKEQLERMPHVMFGGLNHDPAWRLAQRLASITPGDLSHVFFSDSGSVAVEVGLKIVVQYWRNKGEATRTRFIHFRHGYHGDTAGCMAISDSDMHTAFKDYAPQNTIADLPQDEKTTAAFDMLLHREKNNIAAVIIEPLVQAAGGMKFHSKETLQHIAKICKQHDTPLIADEIFTGFGRTASMFACEEADIVPDILCIGKALTGGAITLAATLARPHIFNAFWSDDPKAAFMHGPTYMANPLACTAANASLDLFENEPRLDQVKKIESALSTGLEPCRNMPGVNDVRVKGAIGVVEMEKIKDMNKLKQQFVDHGVWIRPLGKIIYLTPAFTISEEELSTLTSAVCAVVKDAVLPP